MPRNNCHMAFTCFSGKDSDYILCETIEKKKCQKQQNMRSLIKLFSRGLCDGNTDGRHKIMISLKQYQVRKIMPIRNDCTLQGKSSANHYCQGINWKMSLLLMSLVFSFKHYQAKLWN